MFHYKKSIHSLFSTVTHPSSKSASKPEQPEHPDINLFSSHTRTKTSRVPHYFELDDPVNEVFRCVLVRWSVGNAFFYYENKELSGK